LKATVGKKIDIADALSKSVGIIVKNPVILVPQLIITVVVVLLGLLSSVSALGVLNLVSALVSALLSVLVIGAYPLIVKTVLDGGPISISVAVRRGIGRFWSLFAAGIVVGLFVIAGTIALIVPGIIILTWYAYTFPAIMLEDKGAMEGMSASKAFGRDKKMSTFLMFLVIGASSLVVAGIQVGLSFASPVAGRVVSDLLSIPIDVWLAVTLSYTYITYGPSSVPATTEVPSLVPRYCPNCGKPIQAGSMFCPNCGSSIS
jgi:hypothetical protein